MGARHFLRRYGFAWAYLVLFLLTQIVYARLDARAQASFTAWASTSVANLKTDPIGCLVVSAFVTGGQPWVWMVLIGVALLAACHVAGNRPVIIGCVAGHVIGTLVSEGIVAYRVQAGQLPLADNHLTDVGPSYVVVAALALTLIWPGLAVRALLPRAAAAADLLILIFPGGIFGGLGRLDVAAIGHLTSIVTASAYALISGHVARRQADQVGNGGSPGTETELPDGAAPERPPG
jgi:hypothetical protein